MTLKQQIKDAKLLLGLNPGCHIVCKRKKKAPVQTKVMTSKEKTEGLIDDELRKAEKANYIIRTEKPRIFETEGKIKKIEKSEQEILNLVENIIKKEVGIQKQILQNREEPIINKVLKDVETQTINEIVRDENKAQQELKDRAINSQIAKLENIQMGRPMRLRKEVFDEMMKFEDILGEQENLLEEEKEPGRRKEIHESINNISKALKDLHLEYDKFKGSGKVGTGMTDQELDYIMKDEPYYQNCISADEINTLKPHKKMEFIINTDPKSGPGKHWCACFIDIDGEKEIDYYDPLADDPTERFKHDIQKYLVDKLDPKTLLKFKINKVVDQRSDTDTCGLMCVNFLKKRNRGVSFKDATGYVEPHINKTKQFEKEAMEIRRSAGFGYI